MVSNRIRAIFACLFVVLLLSTVAVAQEETETPSPSLDEIPPEIAAHTDDWPLANRDYLNTRAVTTSNINSSTVDDLEVAWTFPIPGRASFGAAASAPIIVSGVVYFQDLESNVFAIDLHTGEVIWETHYDNAVIGPNGPGIGYDKIFVISGVDSFSALDMNTGTEVWTVDTEDRPSGAFQPYVYGGYVYYTTQAGVGGEGDSSYRGYAGGTSGHILALDPETGDKVWDFQTVEEGFWGNPELNSGGGVWFSPAIDTETQLTFWGTGNPAPFPGTFDFPNASSREEPNLYANSLLALKHDTGEMVWHNYGNPNDLFDLDFQISPMLATIRVEGEAIDIVIGSGKLGDIIAMNRETGETIWRTPVGIHQNDDLTEIPPGETVTVYPGILGGVETPMAYADGIIYAPVLNLPTEHSPTGWEAETGTEALNGADAHTSPGSGTSELVAVDATNGQILWSHEFGSDMYGGATVVSDLVFVATFDGMIYALNGASGETEWSYQAPSGINAWPAVADDTIVWPAGSGADPVLIALRLPLDADAPAETTEMPEPEATAEVTTEPDVETTQEAEATPDPQSSEASQDSSGEDTASASVDVEGDPEAGEQLFTTSIGGEDACSGCHAISEGSEDGIGPSLSNIAEVAPDRVDDLNAVEYIHQSIVEPNAHVVEGFAEGIMPESYGADLSEQEINNLIAYLLSQ